MRKVGKNIDFSQDFVLKFCAFSKCFVTLRVKVNSL